MKTMKQNAKQSMRKTVGRLIGAVAIGTLALTTMSAQAMEKSAIESFRGKKRFNRSGFHHRKHFNGYYGASRKGFKSFNGRGKSSFRNRRNFKYSLGLTNSHSRYNGTFLSRSNKRY